MRKIILVLSLLFCGVLTACTSSPDKLKKPSQPVFALEDSVAVTLYELGNLGTKELFYDANWKFSVQDAEEFYGLDMESNDPDGALSEFGTSVLVCRDLNSGNEWVLDELEYGARHSYWEKVQLYSFSDILGCNGFIFEHPAGAAYEAYDFYAVNDSGTSLIARCNNAIYTADLDGDGQLELMTNYHNMGYLDLFWTEGENSIVCSCSLNETARDYMGLIPGSWVCLELQDGSSEIAAGWSPAETGQLTETRTLDLVSLWKWERARTEFWDILPLYTDDGRDIEVRLRENRSSPDDIVFRNHYQVDEIQVYDGNALIQTISPDDLSYDGEYLFEGLFVVHGFNKVPGEPDVQDFNFDGSNDLGLMTSDAFPHNVPYCYFLWDPEAGQLSTDFFILFSPLEADQERQLLIEPVSGGEPFRYYQYDEANQLILVNTQ